MTHRLPQTARCALVPGMDPTAFGGTRWEPWTAAADDGTAYRLEPIVAMATATPAAEGITLRTAQKWSTDPKKETSGV